MNTLTRKHFWLRGLGLAAAFCLWCAFLGGPTFTVQAQEGVTAQTFSWAGAAADGLWSNPLNWEPQGVPGPLDTARFGPEALGASVVDGEFGGELAGLTLEAGFSGRIRLEHDLYIHGRVTLPEGQIEQGAAALSALEWLQTGGENGLLCPADTPNGYAYFGMYTYPGIVVKVDLLARVLNTSLNLAYRDLTSAVGGANNNNSFTLLAGVYTETVTINRNLTFTPDPGVTLAGSLTVNTNRTLTLNGSLALTGDLAVNGTLNQTAGTFTFGGTTTAGGSGTIRLRGVTLSGALTAPAGL